ncbi:uncharacterized protein PHACADRAFT_211727 [Phanerochaete carnosa HHB-10118-sp]|uniref:Cytochrome P450 n=1 Tax=Phanerochaete carnosa (strain HHB-10118-sp) TaxID=650164 RepID=K5VM13_PHACS|nr:uncharacterized protein PHACADRAFT_211727 [Phanerochaete carnosa HHB-10118-sp]EKM52473.1 hypothetical protein PHACADRAFT_211727 [Phanerochaete carnosa HHB-10118-sp]
MSSLSHFTPLLRKPFSISISVSRREFLLLLLPFCALTVHHPPIVDIPADDIFNKPLEAYETALRNHGPVIGVRRKGRLEYILGREYTKYLFADDKNLSFEEGVATVLNLRFILAIRGGKFFKDVDRLVASGMIPRIEGITNRIFPIFMKHATGLVNDGRQRGEHVDFFAHAHHSIAESMLTVVMGEQYVNDQHLSIIEDMAHDIANMTGIYQNLSYFARTFPWLWRIANWTRIIFGTLLYRYFFVLGPHIWRELRHNTFVPLSRSEKEHDSDEPLLHFMGRMFAREDGTVSVADTLWSACLVLSLIFASVHQTAVVAVWVMYELAARPSYIPAIQDELMAIVEPQADGTHHLSYESLRNARYLDSFIREVMRLKGDTLGVCRQTVQDTPMGDYVIPKGHLVIPMASLSHRSTEYHGEDAELFDGFRWVEENQPAVMVSPAYFPFGLNRWACPGRVLAVAEMKMIALTILSLAHPILEGGKYTVVDPLNITSVQPAGKLFLSPLAQPLI